MKIKLTNDFDNLYAEGALVWGDYANTQEKKSGQPVLRLQIGQPDFPPHPLIRKAIAKAYQKTKTGYGPPLGIEAMRKALARELENYYHRVKLTEENIAITAGGGKAAIGVVTRAILSPKDRVLVPSYGYPGHLGGITDARAQFFSYQLDPQKNYDLDGEDFERKVKKIRPKAIFLLSPGNPTGGVLSRQSLERMAWAAKKFDLTVMADEIYRAHVFDGEFVSILDYPGMLKQTVVVDGPSKRNCLTGARVGYIIADRKFIDVAVRKLNNVRFACPPTPEQVGLAETINHPLVIEYIKMMKEEFKKRRDFVVKVLNNIPGIFCPIPEGAFYCYPDIKKTGYSGETFAKKLLEKENVCVLPGVSFGGGMIDPATKKPFGYYHIRISIASSMKILKEALLRIKKFLS